MDARKYSPKWLTADMLPDGGTKATVMLVYEHTFEPNQFSDVARDQLVVEFEELPYQPLPLGKTQNRAMIDLLGADTDGWLHKTVYLSRAKLANGNWTIDVGQAQPESAF